MKKNYKNNKIKKEECIQRDRASRNLAVYMQNNKISVKDVCGEIGLDYINMSKSLIDNKRNLEVDEFLEICDYINMDPRKFK